MNDDDLAFVTECEKKFPHSYGTHHTQSIQYHIAKLCTMVREQDKRARHVEAERDAFNTRIDELETEHAKSWDTFEKEALDALGFEVIGMCVDAGSDIPGMIRRLHERYSAEIRREQTRRIEAEEQRDTYKRIANMKRRKDTP